MNYKKYKIILILLLIVSAATFFVFLNFGKTKDSSTVQPQIKTQENKIADYKASFAIFTRGTLREFNNDRYHNQSDDAYLSSESPSILSIKKGNITWDDFFKTLPMGLDKDCLTTGTGQKFCNNETESLKFYINGNRDADALDKIINEGDKLLVTFGSETEDQVNIQLKTLK